MNVFAVLDNRLLIATLTAWFLAGVLKVPIEYLRSKEWNWALIFSTGGMPSTHTAVVSAVSLGTGLWVGFDSPLFAVCIVLTMVVVYDATGIRRQAGRHAALLNAILDEVARGHTLKQQQEEQLKEILGHTWIEALVGIAWGSVIVFLFWFYWK